MILNSLKNLDVSFLANLAVAYRMSLFIMLPYVDVKTEYILVEVQYYVDGYQIMPEREPR